jgi:hypothetical protein
MELVVLNIAILIQVEKREYESRTVPAPLRLAQRQNERLEFRLRELAVAVNVRLAQAEIQRLWYTHLRPAVAGAASTIGITPCCHLEQLGELLVL